MNLTKLNEKSKEYSIPQEDIDKREAARLSFVSKFPIDAIKDLSVDQYVQGTDDNSFCYWLEFKNILFGIGGGNASKFGLYKATKDGYYYKGFAKKKEQVSGLDLQNYFEKIKDGILKALEYTANDEIEKIKTIDCPIWNMVLQKILSIYYPDKFLVIGAPDVLIECARNIGIQNIELTPQNSIQINYECKKALSALPEYRDWSYEKIGSFIWENYAETSKRNYYIIGSKYDGQADNDIFPEMLKKSVIATGFAPKINLGKYYNKNQSEITAYLKEHGEEAKSYNALKHFLNLKPGDYIAIKADGSPKGSDGFLSIEGIAEVVEKDGKVYRHDPDGLGHLINVKYVKAPVYKEFNLGGYGRTIHKLSNRDHIDLIFKADYPHAHQLEQTQKVENMTYPLNTIFYGPPGTGKTYNTVLRAAEIIANRTIDSHKEALEIFKKNLHDRIEFITFHQNYSYEDFIQGLRPDTDNDDGLNFQKRDGVFKIIADRALKNIQESEKTPEVINKKIAFDEALETLKDKIIESDKPVKINETAYFVAAEDDAFRYTGDNWTLNQKGFSGFRMKYSDLIRFFEADIQARKDIKTLDNISGLAKQHASYFFKAYEMVKNLMSQIPEKRETVARQNYVLVIDEINRANISRVFGELITLIEADKRSDGSMPMEAILPSGDKFSVPSNLYIIGTMNTADKSIALLDIALRRRFEFEAMYPIYEIEGRKIYDADILLKMNEQIIRSKGYDFQIGHSFFMGSAEAPYDFKNQMNKKVIPLLLEYFMNDKKEVVGILEKSGVSIVKESWPITSDGKSN